MRTISGTFTMEVRDDIHGQDIEDLFNEIREEYKLNVLTYGGNINVIRSDKTDAMARW